MRASQKPLSPPRARKGQYHSKLGGDQKESTQNRDFEPIANHTNSYPSPPPPGVGNFPPQTHNQTFPSLLA